MIVLKKSYLKFQNFLFFENKKTQLGFMRVFLFSSLLYIACYRHFILDQLSENALIPRNMALQVFPDFYRPLVQWFFWPDQYITYVHSFLLVLLFLGIFGLSNRFLMLLTWIIHQGIINRNYAINFGADSIGGLFLFYIAFTDCCASLSLKNILFERKKEQQTNKSQISYMLSAVFVRLMQFQICIIYAYTGFEKLKGNTWWDGTALWTVFANPQFSQYDLKFLSHIPWAIALGTFLTVAFEIYFPALVLSQKTRPYVLLAGVLFHLGIGFFLGLMPFSIIMISTYFLFLPEEKLNQILDFCIISIKNKVVSK